MQKDILQAGYTLLKRVNSLFIGQSVINEVKKLACVALWNCLVLAQLPSASALLSFLRVLCWFTIFLSHAWVVNSYQLLFNIYIYLCAFTLGLLGFVFKL